MKKYTKSTTTYTLRKRSQGINGGTIYERDWTTLGEHLRFGKGKTPLYYDGNFIFTTSNIQLPSRRNKPIGVIDKLTYKDVKDAKSTVNNVTVNTNSDDIRSFVYYGSCVELVESSISHIIQSFPACIYSTNKQLEFPITQENGDTIYENINKNGKELFILSNPFLIDLTSKNVEITDNDNPLRFMCESYEDYEINGDKIIGYEIDFYVNKECPSDDQWYIKRAPIFIIKFETVNGKQYFVYGFKVYDDIVLMSEYNTVNSLTICPNNELIEKYFDKLKGFERQLLNRNTNPIYSNIFITPVEGKTEYKYVNRRYKWPIVNDYCIDIETSEYSSFVQSLLSMATIYDELWCDNLYSKMTHEAIKNFDWTYTRDYIDGEEQDNIDGGLRIQRILHLYGRVFDEIKHFVDGIKNNNNISYNNINNAPNAILSDKLELSGWDVVSTIMTNGDNSGYVKLLKEFIDDNNIKWFDGSSIDRVNTSVADIDFMRRLLLSSKRIFMSKGTQESIEMVMGMFGFGRGNDYEIIENYYEADAKWIDENKTDNIRNKINSKNSERLNYAEDYEVDFENLPLKEYTTKLVDENGDLINQSFIIPFYDKNEDYGHDIYFQSKGGWGKYDESNKTLRDFDKYSETISYLNVVTSLDDLLNVNSITSNKGDIYYVVNLEGYTEYYGNINNDKVSHFFVLNNEIAPYEKGSWKNIYNVYTIDADYFSKEEWQYYKEKAKYLDNIVNKTIGNNPHVGFGFYDDGNEYMTYMNEPFKYFIDENEVSIVDEEGNEDTELNNEINNFNLVLKEGKKFNTETIFNTAEGCKCRLNNKVIYFENKINNEMYKKYFKEIILHYLMQVIPSTTILILKNI